MNWTLTSSPHLLWINTASSLPEILSSFRSVSLHDIFTVTSQDEVDRGRPRPASGTVYLVIQLSPLNRLSQVGYAYNCICLWLWVCSFQCNCSCTWFFSWAISLLLGALFFMWSNMIWASASRALVFFRSFLKRFSVSMSPLLTWGVGEWREKATSKHLNHKSSWD